MMHVKIFIPIKEFVMIIIVKQISHKHVTLNLPHKISVVTTALSFRKSAGESQMSGFMFGL